VNLADAGLGAGDRQIGARAQKRLNSRYDERLIIDGEMMTRRCSGKGNQEVSHASGVRLPNEFVHLELHSDVELCI
jgi:hypothetical protein